MLLRRAMAHDDRVYIRLSEAQNALPNPLPLYRSHVARRGSEGAPTVIAVGPMFDRVASATSGRDVNLLYAATVRPFDHRTLLTVLGAPEVIIVEPYQEGTSAVEISLALEHVPHRLLSIGVPRIETRRYGSMKDHDIANGLDTAGIRARIDRFLASRLAA